MRYILSIIGIVGSFLLIKFRERVGDNFGDPEWAAKVGGIYNVIIIVGLFIFFWSIAELTGTTQVLLGPILNALPMQHTQQQNITNGIPLDEGN